jgi:GNAT superfamily N-acetyltransferase
MEVTMETNDSLTIREASLTDAWAVAELLQAFNGGAVNAETAARRMEAVQLTETIFLATLDGVAVGLCSIRIQPFLSADTPCAEVTELFVRPEQRGKGVALRLMARAEALAILKGASEVILMTGFKNGLAQGFYRKAGYGDYAGNA